MRARSARRLHGGPSSARAPRSTTASSTGWPTESRRLCAGSGWRRGTPSASSCRSPRRRRRRSTAAGSSARSRCRSSPGFGAEAVARRLIDSGARVLVTVDGFVRRGSEVAMKSVADAALADATEVERVLVWRRSGAEIAWDDGRDVDWDEVVPADPEPLTRLAARRPSGAADLHERQHRAAEGRRAHPLRPARQRREGRRLPRRHRARRPPLLGHRHRLDHGRLGDRRRRRDRGLGLPRRGRARDPAGPPLEADRRRARSASSASARA